MAALNLHLTLFSSEKESDLPLRSATPFLRPSQDGSPQSAVSESAAYQDIIQRQPTHPDGPTRGWDLGLNLLGDRVTPAEQKSLNDLQTKTKLWRLHIVNVVFEVLFGLWGTYTAIRYCIAFGAGSDATEGAFSLALGIISAIAVGLVVTARLLPLFPHLNHLQAWRYARSIIRACYLLLLSAAAVTNLALVLMWHPDDRCDWDLDISWYVPTTNTSSCQPTPVGVWVAAATLRLVMTVIMALLFIYTLYAYDTTRHPSEKQRFYHYPYFTSDPEDAIPVLTSSPEPFANSPLGFTRSDDSNHAFIQSSATLVKSNSNSTLAPSLSYTGYAYSHSPSAKGVSPLKISPTTSRRTFTQPSSHASSSSSPTSADLGPETPSATQSVTSAPPGPRMLRRTSRISITKVSSDTMLSDISSHSDNSNSPTITREPSEIKSTSPWKSGSSYRGTSVHVQDARNTSWAWESSNGRGSAQAEGSAAGTSTASTSTNEDESIMPQDDLPVYAYGYGAPGPTYPYLELYNPQRPGRNIGASCEDVGEDEFSPAPPAYRLGQSTLDGPNDSEGSDPASPTSKDDSSEGEEEEYVPMMGGFVRRMATIESLGSREAATTTTTTSMSTGSFVVSSPRSQSPTSQLSSLRFANLTSSLASSMGHEHPPSTAYWSASSGFTGSSGMRVNERGELMSGQPSSRSSSSYDRQFYTASGRSLATMSEEDH